MLPHRSRKAKIVMCHMYECRRARRHGPILVKVHGSSIVIFCTIALYS